MNNKTEFSNVEFEVIYVLCYVVAKSA